MERPRSRRVPPHLDPRRRADEGRRCRQGWLRQAAGAVAADEALLYVLDETTTELRLEAAWRGPAGAAALGETASARRPLHTALADLEALCGHAVVMERPFDWHQWQPPVEPCGSAICLPVATRHEVLGTLWLLAEEPRLYNDEELAAAESQTIALAEQLLSSLWFSEVQAQRLRAWDRPAYRRTLCGA